MDGMPDFSRVIFLRKVTRLLLCLKEDTELIDRCHDNGVYSRKIWKGKKFRREILEGKI